MADSETGETAEVQVQTTPAPAIIEVTPLIEERLILKSTKAREGPGRAFGRLANLKKGGRVRVTGQTIDGDWCRVVLAEDGEGCSAQPAKKARRSAKRRRNRVVRTPQSRILKAVSPPIIAAATRRRYLANSPAAPIRIATNR
jgi:hypothetical protein